jgi:phage gpG-like protein
MIEAAVVGTQDVVARISKLAPAIRTEILKRLDPLLIRMQTYIKTEKLQHGTPLHRRTGTLSRSIHYDVQQTAEALVGRVYAGPEAPYAAVHELGGTFTFNVPAHIRTITQAFGRPIAPTEVGVRAYSYSATYQQRAFLKPTLVTHRPYFQALVHESVKAAGA